MTRSERGVAQRLFSWSITLYGRRYTILLVVGYCHAVLYNEGTQIVGPIRDG